MSGDQCSKPVKSGFLHAEQSSQPESQQFTGTDTIRSMAGIELVRKLSSFQADGGAIPKLFSCALRDVGLLAFPQMNREIF